MRDPPVVVAVIGVLLGLLGGAWAWTVVPPASGDPVGALREAPGIVLDLRALVGDRAALLDPATALPQTHRHDRGDLRSLAAYAGDCGGRVPIVPVALAKALAWATLRCGGAIPDGPWLSRGPAMHPSGRSFGAMAIEAGASGSDHLHALERTEGPLAGWPADALSALAAGALTADGGPRIAVRTDAPWEVLPRYRVVDRATADAAVAGVGFAMDEGCPGPVGGLCLGPRPPDRGPAMVLAAGWGLLAVALGWGQLRRRRRAHARARERAFVLRTLTHELRTPVTAMTLAAETLRVDVDALPQAGQRALGRLLDDAGRLRRTLDATSAYLALHRRDPVPGTIEVRPWLEDIVGAEVDAPSGAFRTDVAWLELAVGNLVSNAHLHGAGPVAVCATLGVGELEIRVTDAGEVDGPLEELVAPFVSGGDGLGLGLSLVHGVATALGGSLTLSVGPTTFVLTVRALP